MRRPRLKMRSTSTDVAIQIYVIRSHCLARTGLTRDCEISNCHACKVWVLLTMAMPPHDRVVDRGISSSLEVRGELISRLRRLLWSECSNAIEKILRLNVGNEVSLRKRQSTMLTHLCTACIVKLNLAVILCAILEVLAMALSPVCVGVSNEGFSRLNPAVFPLRR